MIKKMYHMVSEFTKQAGRKNINAYAASTAFFLFLSIVPMLILLCSIIPFTPLSEEDLVTAIVDVVPAAIDPLAKGLVSEIYGRSAGILSIAALTTLWSAGKGVLALMQGLNAINEVEEKRNYFLIRIIASLYTIIMLVILILSLFLMVFGNQLLDLVIHYVPQIRVLISFLRNFRFLAVWVVLTILFSAIYAYVPDKKHHFRDQVPGACFAAVIWSIFSWGFSLYVSRTGAYSIYGSLSIIVIVMFWLYFCMYIVMMGAYLNRFLLEDGEEGWR